MPRTSLELGALFAFAPVALLAQSSPRPRDAAPPTRNAISHYEIVVTLEPRTRTVHGRTTLTFSPTYRPRAMIALDLAHQLTVDTVAVGAAPCAYQRDGDRVLIPGACAARLHTRAPRISVAYHGAPDTAVFAFGEHGGVDVIASWGVPFSAKQWWANLDSPASKADSVDLLITVPRPLVVASNGRLIGVVPHANGTATYHWAVRSPIYPDVVSVAATNYVTVRSFYHAGPSDSMPVTSYVYPEDSAKAARSLSLLPRMLASHAALFGPYPYAYEKYGVAEFPIHSYREHQTLPSLGAAFITGDHRYDRILAHDLAHQWFGNRVSVASWSQVWLNEGFAQYAVALWKERSEGRVAYDSTMQSFDRPDFVGSLIISDTLNLDALFSSTTFSKGAWVLHMLRHVEGDSAFFRTLRQYVDTYAERAVTTADFERVAERVSGASLDWFFREWVTGSGRPVLRSTWTATCAPGPECDVTLVVTQEQTDAPAFRMPVDVAVRFDVGADTLLTVPIDGLRTSVHARVPRRPREIVLDPNHWLLKSVVP